MGVVLLHELPEVGWTKNPIRAVFRSDLKLESPGQLFRGYMGYAGHDLEGWNPVPAGSVLSMQMYGVQHLFTYKANPVYGENELPVYTSGTMEAYLESVRYYLLSNHVLANNYTITITDYIEKNTPPGGIIMRDSPPYLRFEAKEPDDLSTITIQGQGLQLSTKYLGISPVYRKNLKVYAELWVYEGPRKKKLISVNIPTDNDGRAEWDISIPLHNYASLSIKNEDALSGVVRYYINFSDVYGFEQVVGNYSTTPDHYALWGGVPQSRIGETVVQSLVSHNTINWLGTKSYHDEYVVSNQEYTLSIFNPLATMMNTQVCANLIFEDGLQYEIVLQTVDFLAKQKLYVNALDERIFSQYPDQDIRSWEIYLKHNDAVISERCRFQFNENRTPYVRFVKYLNSYGAMSYINMYGKAKVGYEIDQQLVDVMNASGYQETSDTAIRLKQKEVLRTGYQTKKNIEGLRDFFLSEYKYIQVGNRWVPIVATTKEVVESEDGNNLYALEIEIEHATYEYVGGTT